jgi:hypothetical protein
VPEEPAPPRTDEGLRLTDPGVAGAIARVASKDPLPLLAVIVAVVSPLTAVVVIGKVDELTPH